jgi:hypothetical protein
VSKLASFILAVFACLLGALSLFLTDAPQKIGYPMTIVSAAVGFIPAVSVLYYVLFIKSKK